MAGSIVPWIGRSEWPGRWIQLYQLGSTRFCRPSQMKANTFEIISDGVVKDICLLIIRSRSGAVAVRTPLYGTVNCNTFNFAILNLLLILPLGIGV